MSEHLVERNGYYYYYRRVPKHFAPYDPRSHIRISLKTKDRNVARKRALVHNESVERFWRDLASVPGVGQDEGYRKAVEAARLHGFVYRDISDIAANADLGEIVDRLLALRAADPDRQDIQAVQDGLLGTASEPQVLLSQAFSLFRERSVDRLAGKHDHQVRKWENPRRLAMQNLIEAIGDKPLAELARKDILAFQDWWLDRIRNDEVKAETANKHFGYVKDVLDGACVACELDEIVDVPALFAKVKLRAVGESRKPFEAVYVQDVLLNSDALNGMNAEAKALLYMMADTGARVGEVFGLMPEDIDLGADIPFIHVRPNEKQGLKTPQSDRRIPLVGAALYAAQQFPGGLSRFSSADSASTQINKYLRENGLNPSREHSLYSLRHTFKDRLRDVQAPEEVIDNLMGHKSRGPKYGRGHILATKLEWLNRIAFDATGIAST